MVRGMVSRAAVADWSAARTSYAYTLTESTAICATRNRMRVASHRPRVTLPSGPRNALRPTDTTASTVPAIWGVLLNPTIHLLQDHGGEQPGMSGWAGWWSGCSGDGAYQATRLSVVLSAMGYWMAKAHCGSMMMSMMTFILRYSRSQ
jgi:hypothetical protein